MTFDKRIFEAINKGVKFAIDDYEDTETLATQKAGRLNDVKLADILITECYDNLENNNITKDIINKILTWYKRTTLKYQITSKKQLTAIINLMSTMDITVIDLNWIDISKLKDLTRIFSKLKRLNPIDCSQWDTSHVEKFNYIFAFSSYTTIKANNWRFDNAIELDGMFYGCRKSLNVEIDMPNWNTTEVETLANMFSHCSNPELIKYATKLDISNCRNFVCMFASTTIDIDLSSMEIPKDAPGAFKPVKEKDYNEEALMFRNSNSMLYQSIIPYKYLPTIVDKCKIKTENEQKFLNNLNFLCATTNIIPDLDTVKLSDDKWYECIVTYPDTTKGKISINKQETYFMARFDYRIVNTLQIPWICTATKINVFERELKTLIRKRLKYFKNHPLEDIKDIKDIMEKLPF